MLSSLLDLILPIACAVCGFAGRQICPACADRLGSTVPVGRELGDGLVMVAAGEYTGALRDAVLACKRTGASASVAVLAQLAADVVVDAGSRVFGQSVALVPVHSGSVTRGRTGLDLVGLLAKRTARSAGTAGAGEGTGRRIVVADLLVAGRHRRVQKGLDSRARQRNVAGLTRVRSTTVDRGMSHVIFDDVVTTGATVLDAARALRVAGIPPAGVLAIASASIGRRV